MPRLGPRGEPIRGGKRVSVSGASTSSHSRIMLDIRFRVRGGDKPTLQEIRRAMRDGIPDDWEVAIMDWAHPDAADPGWRRGTADDLEKFQGVLKSPGQARIGIEQREFELRRVPSIVRQLDHYESRHTGRIVTEDFAQRHPEKVVRRYRQRVRHRVESVPVFEARIEVDYKPRRRR